MKKELLPLGVDLKGKVAVVTGAGGVLCSIMAEALAAAGAKVALLDRNEEAAQKFADEIVKDGGIAKGYAANVLERDSLASCHKKVLVDFGKCDILINGAGGNNPRRRRIRNITSRAIWTPIRNRFLIWIRTALSSCSI